MGGMHAEGPDTRSRWAIRFGVLVVAVVLGGAIGATTQVMASATDEEVVAAGLDRAEADAPAAPAPAPAEAPDRRMARGAEVVADLVGSLRAQLPMPDLSVVDPYAPTPEIVHGTMSLPTIGVSQPLQEGTTLTAINRGPSHWPGTALPGELGNVVIAGHRTTYSRPFWDLDLVQPGDPLIFDMADGSRHEYELVNIEIVDDSAMHIVDQSYAYTATLFGCHPKGSAAQRIVGHFRLVKSTPAPAT